MFLPHDYKLAIGTEREYSSSSGVIAAGTKNAKSASEIDQNQCQREFGTLRLGQMGY
jgi:hypothetical protein